jgi:hypothetical protein
MFAERLGASGKATAKGIVSSLMSSSPHMI